METLIKSSTTNHRERYRQIAGVLARHGLGYMVRMLGLERFVPFHRGWFGHAVRAEPYTAAEHVRMALEELGVTFIKLGQVLSTRDDLLPAEYITELVRLQDAAPPVPVEDIEELIVAELGQPIDKLFPRFERTPLATGSIGQAHAATLPDGTEVVVKVRRPNAVAQVEEDLEIIRNLAATASRHWTIAEQYDLVGLADEFARTLRAELDYIAEARNAERFTQNFSGDVSVHVPRIFWDTTTSRVLTLERINGAKLKDVIQERSDEERRRLAERSSKMLLKMVFEDGFFHADPHPGNFFFEPDGRIGLIDFGMVGTVDDRTGDQLVVLLIAITSQDSDRLVDAFFELGVARGQVDRVALRADLDHILGGYYERSLKDIPVSAVIREALAVVRAHHLQLPSNLVLLLKTVVMSEGLGAQLDPDFRLITALAPFAERLMAQQYSPLPWLRRYGRSSLDYARLGVELPAQLRRLVSDAEHGRLEAGVRPVGFEPVLQRLERLTNRLVLAIIAAAFINSIGILMAFYHPPGWEQATGLLFVIGFAMAAGLGVYLALSILRK